jgi:large subunit ribosomal protein L17
MRHRLGYRKLNKGSAERKALLRGLATDLIENGRVETTLERAKELRRVVEPLVTLGRTDTVANRRIAASQLYSAGAVKRLFTEVASVNAGRPGGYTRILKLGFRPGDHARRVLIEFVESKLFGEENAPQPAAVSAAGAGSDPVAEAPAT